MTSRFTASGKFLAEDSEPGSGTGIPSHSTASETTVKVTSGLGPGSESPAARSDSESVMYYPDPAPAGRQARCRRPGRSDALCVAAAIIRVMIIVS